MEENAKKPDRAVLDGYRKEIDQIDSELVRLITERMHTAAKIAEYKKETGMPIFDPARERDKLKKLEKMAENGMESYISTVYSLLFEVSRDYQGKLIKKNTPLYNSIKEAVDTTPKMFPRSARVACQGTDGANSSAAALKLFREPEIEYCKTFDDVIRAVSGGFAEYGVLPVENSTAGIVTGVYKALELAKNLHIVRSVRLQIDHTLLANPGTKLTDITEVISHEQAISQCSKYIDSFKTKDGGKLKVTYAANTAVAAKLVSESGRHDIAAISSPICAQLYSLEPIAKSIQNTTGNCTRFICISKKLEIYPGSDKTTVMCVTDNSPGALYKLLSRFNALGINLTSLISRPIEDRAFEFRFFFDFDTSVYSEEFASLIDTISDVCEEFSYLGSYREMI